MPEAPILVLLAASATPSGARIAPGRAGDPVILGLSLIQRAALAARRAGYAQVFLLADGDRKALGIVAVADWTILAAALSAGPQAALIVAPAAILAEGDWLERAASAQIEPAAWAAIPNRLVVLAPRSAADAAAELAKDGGARQLADVEARLARRFGPHAPISADIDPMIVETPADVRVAERRLLKSLVKDTDGFMARHVERPISLMIRAFR